MAALKLNPRSASLVSTAPSQLTHDVMVLISAGYGSHWQVLVYSACLHSEPVGEGSTCGRI